VYFFKDSPNYSLGLLILTYFFKNKVILNNSFGFEDKVPI